MIHMNQKKSAHNTANRVLCNRAIAVFLFVIGTLIGIPLCQAQLMNTGTINGTVTDQSGSVVTGAKVSITDVGTRTVTQTVSNSDGSFSQVGLESGNYEVTVSSPGFTSFKETGIYLEPTGTYTVNVALKPGAVTTTVTVTGSRAQVQTSTSEISNGYREANLQFRAEFFNIFNHTNPNGPNTNFGAGTFGQITSAADPRIGEVALKLNF